MYLYFSGMVFWAFSILWVYPLFQEQNVVMGMVFACLAFCFYFLFVLSSEPKKEESLVFKLIKSIYLSFLTITLQTVGLWLYIEIISRWRELTFLTPLFKAIFRLFHIPVTVSGGNLYLYGVANYVLTFLPNPSNLGLVYLLMFATGNLSLLFITKESKKAFKIHLVSLVSLVIYLLLRVVLLVTLFSNQEVGISGVSWYYLAYFWHPIAGIITFLPWIFLQHLLLKKETLILYNLKNLCTKETVLAHLKPALYLALSMVFLLVTIFWIPSGKLKDGRVLFEEYYSDWSKSTRPIDDQWYSSASTYNYYTLRTYLNSYYDVTVNESPLENVDLDKYDVVILKIPTKPYPKKVIEKVVNYVRNGGGLWVIGDHTNVFGSTSYLNPLLEPFGMQLRYDGVYQNEHGRFNSLFRGNIINHPIIHKVPVFLFATPCSLQVNNPAMRIVIPGLTTKSYVLSYANDNFFSDTKPDLNIHFGANTLLAAGNYGRGRIAVFTDSTVFSNFLINLPGKTEMALSTISWLNHRPATQGIKLVIIFLGAFFLFMFVYTFKKLKEKKNLFLPATIGLVMLLLAIQMSNISNKLSFKMPEEIRPATKAAFLAQYSSIYLPFADWRIGDPSDYNTFFIWGQRAGICNKYHLRLEDALKTSQALFMILPKNRFTSKDLGKLDNYLKEGGKIILLDHGGDGSSANDFLGNYGIWLSYEEDGKGEILDLNTEITIENKLPIGLVEGNAETILYWRRVYEDNQENTKPIFVRKKVGFGELYVFGGVENFSTSNFGQYEIIPQGDKKQINDLILGIYKMVY
jgi:hypothetical protein